MDGIVVNDETLSVDVIKEVGPRSDFLAHMNTFETCTSNQSPNALTALPVTAGTKRALDMETRAHCREEPHHVGTGTPP